MLSEGCSPEGCSCISWVSVLVFDLKRAHSNHVPCKCVFIGGEYMSHMMFNLPAFFSENTDQLMRHYMSLTVEEAANTECPVMFISFPSAKDPSWETKYPGEYSVQLWTCCESCNCII